MVPNKIIPSCCWSHRSSGVKAEVHSAALAETAGADADVFDDESHIGLIHDCVSVAHYFELNGDLCQDPEIGLEIGSQPDGTSRFEPFFFQMAIPPIYQEVYPDGPNSENRVLKQKLTEFLRTWDQNLADQGFLEAARRAVVNRADRPGE